MEAEIQNFLAGSRPYEEAVRLYCLHGRNRLIKRRVERSPQTPALAEKMAYELGKMIGRNTISESSAQQSHVPSPVMKVAPDTPPTVVVPHDSPADTADLGGARSEEELVKTPTDLAREKSRLHGERAKLSNSLRSFGITDDAGRANAVRQIKAITQRMNAIRLKENGAAKEPLPEPAPPGMVTHLTLANARSNLSKSKAKLTASELGTPKWERARDKVETLTLAVKELEKQLK